MMATLMAHAS